MIEAISNTSPLIYLHRIEGLEWLPQIYDDLWVPEAVHEELREGRRLGYDVPDLEAITWLTLRNPVHMPSQWLALDLGPGELAAMALGLENPGRTLLLDDALARRTAKAAGLEVAGTLKILLEAKQRGLIEEVGTVMQRAIEAGLWVSPDVQDRVLRLAGER